MKPIKYIRGDNYKVNEIKDSFLKLGAHNTNEFEFSNEQLVYYLDDNNYVYSYNINKPLAKLLLKYGEEIKLPEKNELPKTWEEWAKTNPYIKEEFYISTLSTVEVQDNYGNRSKFCYNNLSSKEDAESLLALIKLKRLRDCYNDGWEPDWKDGTKLKFCISLNCNEIIPHSFHHQHYFLAFRTQELRDEFLNNFKDLIKKAKMWL